MQTFQKINVDDLPQLRGQYIVQLNRDDMNTTPITKDRAGFYAEKRVAIITTMHHDESRFIMSGMFYAHSEPLTEDEFVKKFNAEGEDRYYRLMTKEEIQTITDYMFDLRKYL